MVCLDPILKKISLNFYIYIYIYILKICFENNESELFFRIVFCFSEQKTSLIIKKYFLFFVLKNEKYGVFIKHLLIIKYYFYFFLRIVLKNNYTNM